MAIVRSAGTEIIRSIQMANIASADKAIIIGEQHHIYTVLSIIVHAESVATAGNFIHCYFTGYDSNATSAATIHLFKQDMQTHQTFVWNDKFSFNGTSPTDFATGLDATKQDALADQGDTTSQKIWVVGENASDNFDVFCTLIAQNNA